MDIQAARKQLVAKYLKDGAFRAALLKDAKAAVEKELGVKLPAGMNITAVVDSPANIHLVLPPAPSRELSDKDLEAAAGGFWGCMTSNMPPSGGGGGAGQTPACQSTHNGF